jgi:hypothetical protein
VAYLFLVRRNRRLRQRSPFAEKFPKTIISFGPWTMLIKTTLPLVVQRRHEPISRAGTLDQLAENSFRMGNAGIAQLVQSG